jgi:hypothetical protein
MFVICYQRKDILFAAQCVDIATVGVDNPEKQEALHKITAL